MANSNLSSYLYKFGERILTHATTFVVSIILARLLTPTDYGTLSIIMVFIIFSQVIIEGGLSSALIQKKEINEEDYNTTLTLTLILSLLFYISLAVSANSFERWLNMHELSLFLRIIALSLFPAAFLSVIKAKLVREMRFQIQMYITFICSFLSGLIGIYFAYSGYGIWALIIQQMSHTVLLLALYGIWIKWFPKIIININFQLARQLYDYGWKIMLTNLLVRGNNEIISLAIGKNFTKASLGLYDRGKQFPQAASENIDSTIQSVLFPILSRCQHDKSSLLTRTRNMQTLGSYMLFFILAIIAGASPTYIPLLLTEKWIGCLPFLIAWTICYTLNVYTIIATTAINAVGYSKMTLKRQLLTTLPSMAILLYVVITTTDVFNIMIAKILLMPYMFFITAYFQKKAIKYRYSDQIKDLFPNFLNALVVFGGIYGCNYFELPGIVILMTQCVVACIIYLGISYLFNLNGLQYLRKYVIRK